MIRIVSSLFRLSINLIKASGNCVAYCYYSQPLQISKVYVKDQPIFVFTRKW